MAQEEQNSDFFKVLLTGISDILKPGLGILQDSEARAELFGTLGLTSTGGPINLPATTNLDQYIQSESEEVDTFQLVSAIADLTALSLAIEGIIRAGVAAGDNPEFAADEIYQSFLNVLLMDFIRRQSPEVYGMVNLFQVVTQQSAAEGGMNNFFEDVVVDFFKRMGKGLESEESTKAVSDTVFVGFVIVLFLVKKYILEKHGSDTLQIKAGYGYEGASTSVTPNADKISNRFVNYSVTINPTADPDNEITLFNTFGFIPQQQGGIAFITDLSGEVDFTLPVTEDISFKFDASGEGVFRIGTSPEASAGKNNKIKVTYKHDRKKADKFSLMDAPVIKLGFGTYSIAMTVTPDDFEIKVNFEMPFEFGRGDKTGFPWDLLPEKIDEKIPIGFGYSLKRDFFFGDGSAGSSTKPAETTASSGGAAAEEPSFVAGVVAKILNAINLRIPIHKSIGDIVGFETLNLRTGVEGNFDKMKLETSLDFWVKFGPVVTISISRLGFNLNMLKRDDNGGVLGYDMVPSIKPPNGAGIRINAEVIKGGGFLYFDDEKGEYFGSLELEFKNLFTLKAVGIINTIMPDGSKGFSMLIIITAEFSPVQLGFGFTLIAVGGLLGIDRTMEVEVLRAGIRTNAIKSVLFPEDVVGNITRIINDIRQIFPIKEDQFLVGLMGKFGWGSPTLLHIELGFIIEFPNPRVVILGVIKLALPTEDAALLKLQVNFLGVIDFQNKFIYFEAHLFESMLVGFPLTGSLAFAVAWSGQNIFAISVGGFHPDFRDYPTVPTLPGAFRKMARIGLSLLEGGNPKLTIECYFAVTSNSVQFGAKLELLAKGPFSFNLYGMLAFDALFIFDPFSFIISLEATLAIRKGTSVLFGIHFKGRLSGPTPWHVEGEVSFSVLFFDVTIGFSATWGDPTPSVVSATEDLLSIVTRELEALPNWQALYSENQHQYVTLKSLEDGVDASLILHPFGELKFSQRSIPLNYNIEKYGTKKPKDEKRFQISEVKVGEDVNQIDLQKEFFAPGHFTQLTEKEKLNRKSYEELDSGFKLKDSNKLLTADPVLDPTVMDYELNYTEDDEVKVNLRLPKTGFNHMSRLAAVSKSEIAWNRSALNAINKPKEVILNDNGYAIAKTSDMKEFEGQFRASTLAEINKAYEALISEDPELVSKLQIVESFELAN
ncbi:DUF6603 domain-containing protein [Arenibacter certesii]|uniref:DUF6603 domain-containing protein n=1 Tax=Arenibacter certesii TaxID=228955 RepID=A0A918MLW7_9FLAO|nr:DUF6603 domain-containing protein [Arenibacter certesii]GGW37033.1 hypothetical protein GCM10007383_22360 [Arenibacter certesii]